PWPSTPIWAPGRRGVSPALSDLRAGSVPAQQHPLELLRRHGPAEQIALELMAAALLQGSLLFRALHTLGQYRQAHALGQQYDHLRNLGAVAVLQYAVHEALVDLQLIQRQPIQIVQRGVAGAEVVQREADAVLLELLHLGDDAFYLLRQGALGQLQLQSLRRSAGLGQSTEHPIDEVGLSQLVGAHVHRQGQVCQARVIRPVGQLPAGGQQHPVAQWQYQTILFRQGYKTPGGDHALLRVQPAHQRFGTQDATVIIHLWLVVQDKLVLFQGDAQTRIDLAAFAHLLGHAGIEEAPAAAAADLGL